LTDLVGEHPTPGPDRAQEGAGERSRSGPGLEDPGAREDVALVDDLRRVLGVDDLGAAGHRQDVVGEYWAQREVVGILGRADDRALGRADEIVVPHRSVMGEELRPLGKDHRVLAALGIGELDTVADLDRTGSLHGAPPGDHGRLSDRLSTLPGVTESQEIGSTGTTPDVGPATASGGDPASGPGLARRPLALSASRAADFRRCPLLYRLRAIDRVPEPKTRAQVLGTVVHSVLEE